MVEVKKILFPIDFTKSSLKVLPYTRHMVEQLGAQLELVYVVRGPEEYSGFEMGAAWFSTYQDELMNGARKAMENFVEDNLEDLKPATAVVMGDIVEEILKYAEDSKADMIIIGTHGRKGVEKIVFGSVAEGVVRRATCPVMTVNPFRAGS